MDLLIKRYNAITVLTYAQIFSSSQISLRQILRVKKKFKKQALKNFGFKNVKLRLFRVDLIHSIDDARGRLFIQEPFIQSCKYDLESFLGHRDSLLTFFSRGVSQPFGKTLNYFEREIFHISTVKKDPTKIAPKLSLRAQFIKKNWLE